MLKLIASDENLVDEMSENVTELCQSEPCSNCAACKEALKADDLGLFGLVINSESPEDVAELSACCRRCIWYYIDVVEII